MQKRIIPVLTLLKSNLVKTKSFKKANYIGDPINAVKILNEKEVDELIILDITPNLTQPDFDLLENIASEAFMPVCYGGAIRTASDIQSVFSCGIEKVSMNSSLFSNPGLVKKATEKYGSSSIVASLDIKKNLFGQFRVYHHKNRKLSSLPLEKHLETINSLNVGELFLNNVNKDGSMSGYDIELIKKVTSRLDIPVIACGGASRFEDFKEAIQEGGAHAVAASSIFLYYGPHKAVLITYPKQNEISQL